MIEILLLCCCVLASVYEWTATNGHWSDIHNWNRTSVSPVHASVVFPPSNDATTITITSNIDISSLILNQNVVLLFQNNSTLSISDNFLIKGGTLSSDICSPLSGTSVESLVLDPTLAMFNSHLLTVNRSFVWKSGSLNLNGFSSLVLINSTTSSDIRTEPFLNSDLMHAWGWNSNDKFGGEKPGWQEVPAPLILPISVSDASLGRRHSLVLSTNGHVYTAGCNKYGQLGYVGGDRSEHQHVKISNIIQVLSSVHSSYALSISGSVFSWGRNNAGQLGLRDFTDRDTPSLVPNLKNIKQIAGRYQTVFALTQNGQVFGWGSGANNILCSESLSHVPSPILISSLANIKFISAGFAAYFIKDDGSTLTCGRKLGNPESSFSSPTQFAAGKEFAFIDITFSHALGIDVNGTLWSWGWNGLGQLGNGDTTDSTVPVTVEVIGKVITAAAGVAHSIAIDVNNEVWTWGDQFYGAALGRNISFQTKAERYTPDRIPNLDSKSSET
ncbi:hypothetical protein GEMRC1_004706 [Eukaryota sp. GEM-RC1]